MSTSPALFVLLAMATPQSVPITVTAHVWAPFISPMGEPFRAHSTSDDTLAAWFHRADRNNGGELTVDEMIADCERFFATLDSNHDGQIDPDELDHYEWEIAPEIQVNARTRRPPGQPVSEPLLNDDLDPTPARSHRPGHRNEEDSSLGLPGQLQGAARYGLLNIPEPVAAADADFNRAVTLDEFRQAAIARFELLDTTHSGKITLVQLERLREQLQASAATRHHRLNERDKRVGNPVPAPHELRPF